MSRFKAGTVVRRLGTVRVGRVVQQAPTDSTFETRLRWLDTDRIEVMPDNLLTRRYAMAARDNAAERGLIAGRIRDERESG